MFPEYNDIDYTPSSFQNLGISSVEKIFHGDRTDIPSHILKLTLSIESKQNVLDSIKVLESRFDVYRAAPNYYCTPMSDPGEDVSLPNDPQYTAGNQWAIDKIDLPLAWSVTTGSASVKVGVIDTGIDGDHPDLQDNIDATLSRCFGSAYSNPLEDTYNHGTKVAGIIGAIGNNSVGVSGVCWDVSLVSFRVDMGTGNGSFSTSGTISAIQFAEENDIRILNFSAWSASCDSNLNDAISNYSGLFVCIAGNASTDNEETHYYPSDNTSDNILSVGASTATDGKRSSSNYGKVSVDIFAPGENVMTTSNGGSYVYASGTSMAAPYVTGVAALLLSHNPQLTTAQLKTIILSHGDVVLDSDGQSVFGELCVSGKRLNAYNVFNHDEEKQMNTSVHDHICICTVCNLQWYESHTWVTMGTRFRCTECGMISSIIPGSGISGIEQILKGLSLSDKPFFQIDSQTYLYIFNNTPYLMKASSESELYQVLYEMDCLLG